MTKYLKNIKLIAFLGILFLFIFSNCRLKSDLKKAYYCYKNITVYDLEENNPNIKWVLKKTKKELVEYFNDNFKFSDSLENKFCEKMMFFDFSFKVAESGKIKDIEEERYNLNPLHFEKIKHFFENVPNIDRTFINKDTNCKYFTRISAEFKPVLSN